MPKLKKSGGEKLKVFLKDRLSRRSMTLLQNLQKSAALINVFSPEVKATTEEVPIVRNHILRGLSGEGHVVRQGKRSENIKRVVGVKDVGQHSVEAARLLGFFGLEE